MRNNPSKHRKTPIGLLCAAAEAAREAWEAALTRVRNAEATTLSGVVARLDYLAAVGECDFETAREVLGGIAERQPGLALV